MRLCANRAVSLSGILNVDVIPEEWRHVMLWVSLLVNLSFAYSVTCLHGFFALFCLSV